MGIAINGVAVTDAHNVAIDGRHIQGMAALGRVVYKRQDTEEILPTGVTISPSGIVQVAIGTSRQIVATVYPENATNKTLTWTSTNANAVSVTQDGLVTRNASGTSQIRATTVNGIFNQVTIM